VSVTAQLPEPTLYVSENVPALDGVNTPPDVTPVPVQVPFGGVAVKLRGAEFKHTLWSVPALAAVGLATVSTT
jgi:hypothetical protein